MKLSADAERILRIIRQSAPIGAWRLREITKWSHDRVREALQELIDAGRINDSPPYEEVWRNGR